MSSPPPPSLGRPPGSGLVAKTFEDGGKHYTALSVSFLLVCLYVLATVASATHRLLLLGGSLPLPLLNVPIPLKGFFVVAPILIVVLHVNLLLQSYVLTRRLGDERLAELGGDQDFLLFPAFPVLVSLWQDRREVRMLLGSALLVINAVLPLGVLCFTQYKFVPYHSPWITLVHQVLVILDAVIVWRFVVKLPDRGLHAGAALGVLALVVFYTLFMAVVPGTWIEWVWDPFPPAALLTRNLELSDELLISEPPPPELLAAFEAKGEEGMRAFLDYSVGARLKNRDLRGAELEGAKLFNADLRGADLSGAWLVGADLRNANLTPPSHSSVMQLPPGVEKRNRIAGLDLREVRRTRLDHARLQGANFTGARLILASLVEADLRDTELSEVELTRADLTGANLTKARLRRAELSFATLDGARLADVRLGEAMLVHSSLEGASLLRAVADSAVFAESSLQGAQLTEASLRRTDFRDADLAGADLRRASLQGARSLSLETVDLRGAHIAGAYGMKMIGLVDLRFIDFEDGGVPVQTDLAAGRGLRLLYQEENRPEPLKSWPPLGEQYQGAWDETVFHRHLSSDLLNRACASEGLATTLVLRAAGRYNPGDPEFDLELARQLLARLEEPGCARLKETPPPLKQQISWRLRLHEREQEEDR